MENEVFTASCRGVKGEIVQVEVDISRGLPCFNMVGLPGAAVKEAKERVRSAIINSGYSFPTARITINLSPADVRKGGTSYDLPIALAILKATGQMIFDDSSKYIILGELSLSGALHKVKGVLPISMEGVENGFANFIVPSENAKECSIVEGSKVYAFDNLNQVVDYVNYRDLIPYEFCDDNHAANDAVKDYSEVIGQESAKRAIEIAAAGGHNIILYGPPGSGKSMLAERIPGILPELSYEESLEVTKIYSIMGKICDKGLVRKRPFRAPHTSITEAGLIGGGRSLMPGEISLAHNGVLFLDEVLEFKRSTLDLLRQPLEKNDVTITRNSGSVTYPCNFMLVAAMNPCICGNFGNGSHVCTCSEYERERYLNKLSGPFLDRIDMFVPVNSISMSEMKKCSSKNASSDMRKKVKEARKIQNQRFASERTYTNSRMSPSQVRRFCSIAKEDSKVLDMIYERFHISTRAYYRILKVARTIADLDESGSIRKDHIVEALQYRKFINQKYV